MFLDSRGKSYKLTTKNIKVSVNLLLHMLLQKVVAQYSNKQLVSFTISVSQEFGGDLAMCF